MNVYGGFCDFQGIAVQYNYFFQVVN